MCSLIVNDLDLCLILVTISFRCLHVCWYGYFLPGPIVCVGVSSVDCSVYSSVILFLI